jgi:hypothetical protein
VIEAVGKLNQVKGVKGMRRFFKQIAQSARQGLQVSLITSNKNTFTFIA